MIKLTSVVEFVSGTPQFRIKEIIDGAPLYTFYGQEEVEHDLIGFEYEGNDSKQIRTFDQVNTLCQGDVIFSLISGRAAIVSRNHQGYLYTQNYVKLITCEKIAPTYLVYLLNENIFIRKQFQMGLQGSQVLKYTLKQLRELNLPDLPVKKTQQVVGELYFNQLRLQALKNRVANLETTIILEKIKGGNNK